MPASLRSGHFCRFVNILPTKFSKRVQKPRAFLGHFFSEVLVDVHGDLDVFMSQTMLHILGGGTQLRKHSGVGVPQRMVVEFLKPQLPRCDPAHMLQVPAVDVGTVRPNHHQMYLLSLSGCVEMACFIPILADVKVAVEITGFLLAGLLPFQCRHDIRGDLNGSDAVVLGQGEIPICRVTGLLVLFLPEDLLPDGQFFILKVDAGPVQREGFRNAEAALVAKQEGQIGTAALGKTCKDFCHLIGCQIDMGSAPGLHSRRRTGGGKLDVFGGAVRNVLQRLNRVGNETQQVILQSMSLAASKLWNVGNYEKRTYKEQGMASFPNWYDQKKRLKAHYWFKALPSHTAQLVLKKLDDSWKSFFALEKSGGIGLMGKISFNVE